MFDQQVIVYTHALIMEQPPCPTIYTVLRTDELPEGYEVQCNWCIFHKVTAANRCWISVPEKNVVHQTCATSERQKSKAGYFHCWECAFAFCFYRRGMERFMHVVRMDAALHGYVGNLLIKAPDPLRTLKCFDPRIQGTQKETEAAYDKFLAQGVEVRELHNSEISSARIHRLYKQQAEQESATVLEHTTPHNQDMEEPTTSVEKHVDGRHERLTGAGQAYFHAKQKGPLKKLVTRSEKKTKKTGKRQKKDSGVVKKPKAFTARPLF